MKKKIAILGSTGSIGTTSLKIFKNNPKKFKIILLSSNSNYLNICKQIKNFKPKYFIYVKLTLLQERGWGTRDFLPSRASSEEILNALTNIKAVTGIIVN